MRKFSIFIFFILGVTTIGTQLKAQTTFPCVTLTHSLYLGLSDALTGGDVSVLQQFLRSDTTLYPEAQVTGFYGTLTARAVQRFQDRYIAGASGQRGYGGVGALTMAKIRELGCGGTASPPLPTSPACVSLTHTLYIGLYDSQTGGDVSALQNYLKSDSTLYPDGQVTGYYGALTSRAVQRFQDRSIAGASGQRGYGGVGPLTAAKIKELSCSTSVVLPTTPPPSEAPQTTASTTPPTPLQTETIPPVISSLTVTDVTPITATIRWTTNELTDSQVEYGTDTTYASKTPDSVYFSSSHSITLLGLAPRTTYHFRVRSHDPSQNISVSEDQTFTTLTASTITLQSLGTTKLSLGVTHIHRDICTNALCAKLMVLNNSEAAVSAKDILRKSAVFQNVFVDGFGTNNPNPAKGSYDWTSLDERLALVQETGGTPIITLLGAPAWMRATSSSFFSAPLPEHYADFAELARQTALHHPEVKYFDVWAELKGFWNPSKQRWDYEAYTDMYNLVYDALKSVSSDIQVGGPYTVMGIYVSGDRGSPSSLSGSYGAVNQFTLDALTYWLAHKHGADFISIDGSVTGKRDLSEPSTNLFEYAQYFGDITAWIRARTDLPIWWAEWYSMPHHGGSAEEGTSYTLQPGFDTYTDDHQNAIMTTALMQMAKNGASVALRWSPQGNSAWANNGNQESVWGDTTLAGGGKPFPFAATMERFRQCFPPGVPLSNVTSSNTAIAGMASSVCTLLINQSAQSQYVTVNGSAVSINPYEVKFISGTISERSPAKTSLVASVGTIAEDIFGAIARFLGWVSSFIQSLF